MSDQWEWKQGARLEAFDPREAKEEADAFDAANGGSSTAEEYLEFLRNPNTVMHKAITWDIDRAGHKYQVSEARNIKNSWVKISYDTEGNRRETPAYFAVKLTHKKPRDYVPVEIVVNDEALLDRWIAQAERELQSFRRRYNSIAHFKNLFAEIEIILK